MTQADSSETANTISPSEVSTFVEQFPEDTREIATAMIEGQILSTQVFTENEELGSGQHPKYAVSTGSRPSGQERFSVGTDEAGNTLVYRTLDSQWIGDDALFMPKAAAFFDLAGMKGIPFIVHPKGDKSELLDLAARYSGGDTSVVEGKPEIIKNYVESREMLTHQVRVRGVSYYEDLGIDLSKNADEAMAQARTIQQLAWDCDLSPKRLDLPRVAPVFVSERVGDRFYFFQDLPPRGSTAKRRFLKIDPGSTSWINDVFDDMMARCPDYIEIPSGKNLMQAKEARVQDLIERMIKGVVEHRAALPKLQEAELRFFISCCTDSRSPTAVIAGQTDDAYRWTWRTPGELWFDERAGRFCYDAEMAMAVAEMHGQRILHVQHSTCGAASVVVKGCSGEALLPIGFANLAFSNKPIYSRIMKRCGDNASVEEITDFYQERTGIKVKTLNDCVGLEDLLVSREQAERAGRDYVSFAFQHMSEGGRNYLYNHNTKLYAPVPTLQSHVPEAHCRMGGCRPHR